MCPDLGVDVDALDLDEARLAIGKDRARDGPFALVGHHGQLDIALETRRICPAVVVEILMPRSFAITGADTMFTSGFTDFMMPATARS
jgi:hypothetical protein